jgi:predicted kinase
VIFDCIEFREDFRCEDVAAELAFLTMDMKHRGAAALARRLVAQYLVRGFAGVEVLRLLPFYESHRASIRGFVEAERGNATAARDYFRLAVAACLPPQVILTCGLPASGKSFLARRLARAIGAVWLRSDLVRKELAGMAPTDHWEGGLDAGPYDPAFTERTYAELRRQTQWHRNGGRHVVVDATFLKRAQRERFADLDPLVVHVACPDDVALARLAARAADEREVSDAGVSYYEAAKTRFEPPAAPAFVHDGSAPVEHLLDRLVDRLIT